jgi:hypothetical protein
MEFFSGCSIKQIIKDHWPTVFNQCKNNIRDAIIVNIAKIIACRTSFLGFHEYKCENCGKSIKVPHSCKSRFCTSCGKKATDMWIEKNRDILPNCAWQHITFTMPSGLWQLFWLNRHLLGKPSSIAANIILKIAKKRNVLVGIYTVIHTFGRDLKRNIHIHLSVTRGGLFNKDFSKWINDIFFHRDTVMPQWRYQIIKLFRDEYKNGTLVLPKSLAHIKNYTAFNSWLDSLYKKTWVVHFGKKTNNKKRIVDYLSKYLKRPPIGETRIKAYNGKTVTFEYLDHYTNTKMLKTLSVEDFVKRLVSHIHETGFRCIRYYGFLANRIRGKLLPTVHNLLKTEWEKISEAAKKATKICWRYMILKTFNRDPLKCENCGKSMLLHAVSFPPTSASFHEFHQQVVSGNF